MAVKHITRMFSLEGSTRNLDHHLGEMIKQIDNGEIIATNISYPNSNCLIVIFYKEGQATA